MYNLIYIYIYYTYIIRIIKYVHVRHTHTQYHSLQPENWKEPLAQAQDYVAGISQDFAEVAPALARRGYFLAVVRAAQRCQRLPIGDGATIQIIQGIRSFWKSWMTLFYSVETC